MVATAAVRSLKNASVDTGDSDQAVFIFRGQDGNPARDRPFSDCRTVSKLFMQARLSGLPRSKAPILLLRIRGCHEEMEVGMEDEPDFARVVDAIRRGNINSGKVVIDVRMADPWHTGRA